MKYGYLAAASLALMLVGPHTYATKTNGEPDEFATSAVVPSEGDALAIPERPNLRSALADCPLRSLPGDVWQQIGNESRNTISLKLTCRFFNSLTFNTVRDLTLPRNFPDTPEEAAERYLKALETRGDDVQVLNLYQLHPNKDFGLFGNFQNSVVLESIIDTMNQGRVRKIRHFVFRTFNTVVTMDYDLLQRGITTEYLDSVEVIDQIFSRVALNDRQIRLLRQLYRGPHWRKGVLELSHYIPPYNFDVNPDYTPFPMPLDSRLVAMLDLFGQITATKKGKSLFEVIYCKVFLRHCLHYITDHPDLMEMVTYICCSELCDAGFLFGDNYDPNRWAYIYHKISHKDTIKMLTLLRDFIPKYDETDFCDGVLKVNDLDALNRYVVTNRNGVGISRRRLFECFVNALSLCDKTQQYVCLKRLLPILSLRKIGDVIKDVYTNSRINTALWRGLRAVNQAAFLEITDEEYAAFAVYFQKEHKYVNPLSKEEGTRKKLATILEKFRQDTSKLNANQ